MKKTVIIAIFIIYLASIVAVQLFGIPATVPEGGAYVEAVEITGVTHSGNQEVKELTDKNTGDKWYWFHFIASADEGGYTKEADSIASNPNRIKIVYLLTPDDASRETLSYTFDNENAVFISETEEVVFLKAITVNVTIKESKGNINARDTVRIVARKS